MLSQGAQGAAGRAERSAARVGERSASDRVVLEGAGLAARTEVCVGRRFHGRHAGVIGVQVGVIHLIHGDEPVRTPVCHRTAERGTHSGQRGGSAVSAAAFDFTRSDGDGSDLPEVVCPLLLLLLLRGPLRSSRQF